MVQATVAMSGRKCGMQPENVTNPRLVAPVPDARERSPLNAGGVLSWSERHYVALAVAVLLLAAFNLKARLGHETVTEWDESLYATSALEMVQSNQWVAPTFHGSIDYYNSKPPLNIWLIALSFKAFGQSLYSLRLVSTLSAWLTVLTLLLWTRKHFGAAVAIIASLVLSTSHGFLYAHAGRSANPDALLALLLLLTMVVLSAASSRPWTRAWLGPIVAGVFMLKGMAVLMPLAMIGAAEIVAARPQPRRWRALGVACVLFLAPVLAWGVARWRFDQWQFFERMVAYDFMAGSLTPLEGHAGSWFYYLKVLQRSHYDWLTAAVLALFALWAQRRQPSPMPLPGHRAAWVPVGIWAGVTLLVPMVMQTKLSWYINPFYPALALGVGWLLASALAAPSRPLARAGARRVVAMALLLAACVAESRLVWYSFDRRDLDRSVQGVLLDEAAPMAGKRVFGLGMNRADLFVARAFARAEPVPVANIDSFWRESRAGDYLVSSEALRDARVTLVRSNARSHLHRRQQ